MKKVYKLQDKYFNIEYIKEMSEIKEINEYEEQEKEKKQYIKEDEKIEKLFFGLYSPIKSVRIYNIYDKNCMRISVTINDNEFQCKNYVFRSQNEDMLFSLYEGIVTEEKQKEYEQFKNEATELLYAFKSLEK